MELFKSYVSADLANAYQNARREGNILPNFPTDHMERSYRQLMVVHKINCYHENADDLREEGKKTYPSLARANNIGLSTYFQLKHNQPVINTYDLEKQELELIFPIYKTEQYLSCRLPLKLVQKLIEETINHNKLHLEEFREKPLSRANGLRLDLVQDCRKANVVMRDCFERVTKVKINDPIRHFKIKNYDLKQTRLSDEADILVPQSTESTYGTDMLPVAIQAIEKYNRN